MVWINESCLTLSLVQLFCRVELVETQSFVQLQSSALAKGLGTASERQ